MARLSVNVDHVATLRQARRAAYPDPVAAARIAEAAGASGITIHLRGDRRHIQDADLASLSRTVAGRLNLEMAPTDEMVAIALAHHPGQVTLVPERPEEVTTEGGLDLLAQGSRVAGVAGRLAAAGIAVSVFIDPDERQVEGLSTLAPGLVRGFEINTDAYTRAAGAAAAHDLGQIRAVVRQGVAAGFEIYAGHGLTVDNVGPIARLPEIEELNIGHAIVARAVLVGMEEAVREMLRAMASA